MNNNFTVKAILPLAAVLGLGLCSRPAFAWTSGTCQVSGAVEIIDDWASHRPAHIEVTCRNNLDGAARFILPIGSDPGRAARFWAIVSAAILSGKNLVLHYDIGGNWTYTPLGGGTPVVSTTERFIYNFGL